MSEILKLTLTELTEGLQSRELSPVELMQAVFERIDQRNGDLNAVVSMGDRDDLLAQAREAEERIAAGEGRPLEGVPLGVKDLEDVAGMGTTHGSKLFEDYVAEEDSTQVERLRGAGAIPLGKTNTPEFGFTAITRTSREPTVSVSDLRVSIPV